MQECDKGQIVIEQRGQTVFCTRLEYQIRQDLEKTAIWKMVPLGKGYYDFHFDLANDLRKIWAAGTINLKPGLLRLSQWTKDFKYCSQK